MHFFVDGRIERHFHLVDRNAIGGQLDDFTNTLAPILFGFVEHAGDEVDVDLWKADRSGEIVRPINLLGKVGPAVALEDRVVEVFDAEAQSRYAQVVKSAGAFRRSACPARIQR